MWHYRRYGVEALLALGKKAEAVKFAEASRGLNQPDSVIDQACEEILISSGLHEEAYRCYGLSAAEGNSYLARFRSVAKRYPMKDNAEILADLIATTPGQEGKWFATAKDIKLYDLALELVSMSPGEPKTLTSAARDYVDKEPEFALGSAMAALRWLCEGWGYEVTSVAYDRAMDAAAKLDNIDEVADQVQQLLESPESSATLFVRQSLAVRMHSHHSLVKKFWCEQLQKDKNFVEKGHSAFHPRSTEGTIGDHDRQKNETAQAKKQFKNQWLKWSLVVFRRFSKWCQERT